jgi:phosphoribosylformimino-5-aminoimidazole carboxamide ribotide isomerase
MKDGERGQSDWVLSLDFRGDEFLGPRALLEDSFLWPDRVIVMTLARVGTGGGPDLARVRDIARRAGTARRVYAAGGVRGPADLRALRSEGAAGALVATALHEGKIKAGDLHEIAGL